MDAAEELLDKISSLVKLQKEGAEKFYKLAAELEEKKKSTNVTKVVGSSVSVGGAAAAGVLALCTGGLALPFLAAAGTVASVAGLATNVGSDIKDITVARSIIKNAEEVSEKIKCLEERIQELMKTLEEEGKRRVGQDGGDVSAEDYVMEQIMRAMAKREGLKLNDHISLIMKSEKISGIVEMNIGFKVLSGAACGGLLGLIAGSAIGIVKESAKTTGKKATTSAATKAAAGGVGGAALGVVFSVPELVINCVNLKNCETEISKRLREIAEAMRTASEEMNGTLQVIQTILEEMVQKQQEEEERQRQEEEERQRQEEEERQKRKIEDLFFLSYLSLLDETGHGQQGAVRMALLNVRSINNKRSQIKELIRQNNLSVFCTTETWTQNENAEQVLRDALPENFNVHHQSRDGRGGGGAIMFSDELQGKQIFFTFITTFEYVATVLQHEDWDEPVPVINVYHPPGYNLTSFRVFMDEFQRLLNEVFKKYNSIIVTGDFNIWIDQQRRTFTDEFEFLLLINDLDQHVQEPTHRAGHFLDLVISRGVEILLIFVRDDNISDHYTVYFTAKPVSKDKKKKSDSEDEL